MLSGTRIGPYEIDASIGAGGMGEVFRARDTRLNRDVAIKVLPKDFVAEADRLRHFEQEGEDARSAEPSEHSDDSPCRCSRRWGNRGTLRSYLHKQGQPQHPTVTTLEKYYAHRKN